VDLSLASSEDRPTGGQFSVVILKTGKTGDIPQISDKPPLEKQQKVPPVFLIGPFQYIVSK
jgi:hypothetical protein